ncbi:unnamed protein product, partial [Symbiodinium pilosum]
AFRRFDADSSGHLDANECKNMCAYLGWGLEEASLMDLELRHSQPGKGYEDNE